MDTQENKNKCEFCGSEKKRTETPYVDAMGNKKYNYCCMAQEKNSKLHTKAYLKGYEPKS